ncbi:hypothetical protein CYMTET_45638, partial [Cymbomonas tetramitiformis]
MVIALVCSRFHIVILSLVLLEAGSYGRRRYQDMDVSDVSYLTDQEGILRAAKLYFQLLGTYNPGADDAHRRVPYCPGTIKDACISMDKLHDFLLHKWIPPSALVSPKIRLYQHQVDGHRFRKDTNARMTLEDLVTYLLTRPRKSVPDPVRALLLPRGHLDDKAWPGETSAVKKHLRDQVMEAGGPHNRHERAYTTDSAPFTARICDKKCAMRAISQ